MTSALRSSDDARLPDAVARVLARGETAWVCDHPRGLPPHGAELADFVVLQLAFAWLYPDSMVVVEALHFARLGLILHGPIGGGGGGGGGGSGDPAALLARLQRLCAELGLAARWHDADGRRIEAAAGAAAVAQLAAGRLVIRAERIDGAHDRGRSST